MVPGLTEAPRHSSKKASEYVVDTKNQLFSQSLLSFVAVAIMFDTAKLPKTWIK